MVVCTNSPYTVVMRIFTTPTIRRENDPTAPVRVGGKAETTATVRDYAPVSHDTIAGGDDAE